MTCTKMRLNENGSCNVGLKVQVKVEMKGFEVQKLIDRQTDRQTCASFLSSRIPER